jgi:hypothetical protein
MMAAGRSLAYALCAIVILVATAAPLEAAPAASAAASPTSDPVFAHPLKESTRPAMAASFGALAGKAVVAGSFTQSKRIKRLGRDLVSKGEFLFSTELGVYWNILSPYPSTIVMTAQRLVQKSPEGETSVIDAKDNLVFKRIAGTMQAVFSGDLAALESEFAVYFQGDRGSWRLGLVPKEKTVREVVASLVVEGGDSIKAMRLAEGSGDVVSYAFVTTKASESLEEKERGFFVF